MIFISSSYAHSHPISHYISSLASMFRHPVSWFQSLYNFRVQNLNSLPHPNKLIGGCFAGSKNTCTSKGNFAFDLMRMGKKNYNGPQPMTDLEKEIVGRAKQNASEIPPMPNDVFFFDIAQLGDTNETRMEIFRKDVKEFLGLEADLPPLVHNKPGKKWNATIQAQKDALKINICDDEYMPVRTELMTMARRNSRWIREEFLDLPTVHSSRQHVEEILLEWLEDPCEKDYTLTS